MASAEVHTETVTTTTVTLTLSQREAEELRGVLSHVAMFGSAEDDPGAEPMRAIYEALNDIDLGIRLWEVAPRGSSSDGHSLSSARRPVSEVS